LDQIGKKEENFDFGNWNWILDIGIGIGEIWEE
jgi:hypothetical protein